LYQGYLIAEGCLDAYDEGTMVTGITRAALYGVSCEIYPSAFAYCNGISGFSVHTSIEIGEGNSTGCTHAKNKTVIFSRVWVSRILDEVIRESSARNIDAIIRVNREGTGTIEFGASHLLCIL
jgi:hypothetical protein